MRHLLSTLLLAVPAFAGEPRISVVDMDGAVQHPTAASIEGISDTSWPDWRGMWIDTDVTLFEPTRSVWRLLDGQCVIGAFMIEEDRRNWSSESLGMLQLDLERTRMVGPLSARSLPDPVSDQIHLVNGDRIEGFITGLDGDRGVGIERKRGPGSTAEVTWHPFSSVMLLQLSGRGEPGSGWRIWLRDGSIVDVAGWSRDKSVMRLEGPHLPGAAKSISIPWTMIRGIRPPMGGVLPLAGQPWSAVGGQEQGRLVPARARSMGERMPLDLQAIELAGPGRFRCGLRPGGCQVHMAIEIPKPLRPMGGCTVILREGSREVARAMLDARQPTMVWSGRLMQEAMEIDVQPGPGGPLGSTLIIQEGWMVPITPEKVTAPPVASPPSTSVPGSPAPSQGPG
jgi:hypothetical protein